MVAPVIDRAGDADGVEIRPARKPPADAAPAGAPTLADVPTTDNVRADTASNDAVLTNIALTNTAQLKAAHLHYRDAVANAYGKPRDAWAEALPQLRAAWEEHEQKYPERSRLAPRTQPDGSWEADANRGLNPEQNAEATKICAEMRKEGTEVVLPAMVRVEAADPTRGLAGLPHLLKSEDRVKEKIADELRKPDVAIREALGMVPDTVRFTSRTVRAASNALTSTWATRTRRLSSDGGLHPAPVKCFDGWRMAR
ncbi:MAG: hypothetical protein ABSA02_14650 [Trebonia sp.]